MTFQNLSSSDIRLTFGGSGGPWCSSQGPPPLGLWTPSWWGQGWDASLGRTCPGLQASCPQQPAPCWGGKVVLSTARAWQLHNPPNGMI